MSKSSYKNIIFLLILPLFMCHSPDQDRAVNAKLETWNQIHEDLEAQQIDPNSVQTYIRCFKHEEIVEIWAKDASAKTFKQLYSYPFCTNSGHLGPKRQEGDLQIPEGVYKIDRFNPKSKFHLSLGINYPNQADLIIANKKNPGSDIFIHGKCSSVGCIAIGDPAIKELYTLASVATSNQHSIRVDIFPFKFGSTPSIDAHLSQDHQKFWKNLKEVFVDFEETKELATINISEGGKYIVNTSK